MSLNREELISVIEREMEPALGVTEVGAIALACSKAYRAVGGELSSIEVTTDPGTFKNGYSCMIPGTSEMGNELAAILGVLAGDPDLGLQVLKGVKEEDVKRAKTLRDDGLAEVSVKRGLTEILVDATVKTDEGEGRAVIKDAHTNIVLVEVNGNTVYSSEEEEEEKGEEKKKEKFKVTSLKLADFKEFVDEVPFEDIKFVLDAIEMNKELGQEGMKGAGMGVGVAISDLLEKGEITDDIVTHAQRLTAYSVDARMGGVSKPAMSIAGSGDHGIIATMPLAAVAEKRSVEEERLARAIALSYLVTLYIKEYSGKLSAFCGCAVAAGTGASAGVVYLLGGSEEQIAHAISNVAADITGIICDGGNLGCTLKAMTGASAAVMSALFALDGVVIPKDSGIVGETVEETMENMGRIASPGMRQTDDTILDILTERQ